MFDRTIWPWYASKYELQEALGKLKEMIKKHGMRMSVEKTGVMWVGQHSEELNNELALCTLAT